MAYAAPSDLPALGVYVVALSMPHPQEIICKAEVQFLVKTPVHRKNTLDDELLNMKITTSTLGAKHQNRMHRTGGLKQPKSNIQDKNTGDSF